MIQKLAWVFGIVLILIGVLGFIPKVVSGGLLLGIFSASSIQNIIYLLTGALAVLAALCTASYTRLYFKLVGIVYALFVLCAFAIGSGAFGIMLNTADNILHVFIIVFALWAGFGTGTPTSLPSTTLSL